MKISMNVDQKVLTEAMEDLSYEDTISYVSRLDSMKADLDFSVLLISTLMDNLREDVVNPDKLERIIRELREVAYEESN